MPYQYKDVCYSTESMAVDSYFHDIHPFIQNSTYFFYPEKINGQWCLAQHTFATGNRSLCIPYQTPPFQTCTDVSDPTSQFNQGLELGWAVASVVVVGFVWRYLRLRH